MSRRKLYRPVVLPLRRIDLAFDICNPRRLSLRHGELVDPRSKLMVAASNHPRYLPSLPQ